MTYKVVPATVDGCDCEDCKAGRHIYCLYRWRADEWHFAAISLYTYASVQDCQRRHHWCLEFKPGDTWEDGSPIVEPELVPSPRRQALPGGGVVLDTTALAKSAEVLRKHWRP
jgi:hypothetical protein